MAVVCAVLQNQISGDQSHSRRQFRLDGTIMAKPHRQAVCGQVLTFVQGSQVRVVHFGLGIAARRRAGGVALRRFGAACCAKSGITAQDCWF